jgi:hypothetical protein
MQPSQKDPEVDEWEPSPRPSLAETLPPIEDDPQAFIDGKWVKLNPSSK